MIAAHLIIKFIKPGVDKAKTNKVIGIASDLKKALAVYTKSGGKDELTSDISAAVNAWKKSWRLSDR